MLVVYGPFQNGTLSIISYVCFLADGNENVRGPGGIREVNKL